MSLLRLNPLSILRTMVGFTMYLCEQVYMELGAYADEL